MRLKKFEYNSNIMGIGIVLLIMGFLNEIFPSHALGTFISFGLAAILAAFFYPKRQDEFKEIIKNKNSSENIGLKLIASNGKIVKSDYDKPKEEFEVLVKQKIPGVLWEQVRFMAKTRGIDEFTAWRQIIKTGMAIMMASAGGKELYIDGKRYNF